MFIRNKLAFVVRLSGCQPGCPMRSIRIRAGIRIGIRFDSGYLPGPQPAPVTIH